MGAGMKNSIRDETVFYKINVSTSCPISRSQIASCICELLMDYDNNKKSIRSLKDGAEVL